MKKIVLLIIISVFLFPLTAVSTYVYKGDDSVIVDKTTDTPVATLPLVVDTSNITDKVFYGFYTKEGTVGQDSSDTTTYEKLVFNESIVNFDTYSSTYTYTASANIKFYLYILSRSNKYKLSLKWTHLSGSLTYKSSSSSGGWGGGNNSRNQTVETTIPVSITIKDENNKDVTRKSSGKDISSAKAYEIDTFDPSVDGILMHMDYSYEAKTDEYTNKYTSDWNKYTISSYTNFTGTMSLILSTI